MTHFEGRTRLWEEIGTAIDGSAADISAISTEIFENPEPALGEERATRLLTDYLTSRGFEVQTGLAGMPTAFQATIRDFDAEAMRKGLRHGHVAFLAEYDADEGGHLSGRHLVAGSALAAAVGLAASLGEMRGQVTLIGCPAASTLEGKRSLAAAGAFEPVDAALGAEPASSGEGFQPIITSSGLTVAVARVAVQFDGPTGESDARQRLATALETLATDLADEEHLQASLSETGVEITLRTGSNPAMDELLGRLRSLAEEVAVETGSALTIDDSARTPAMNVNRILARRVKTFTGSSDLYQDPVVKSGPTDPTDWAHVSLVTSTTSARFPISRDLDIVRGTPEFAEASSTGFAFEQMLTIARCIAYTGLDLLGDMEFRGFAEGELLRSVKAQGIERTPRRWLGVHPVQPREASNGYAPKSGQTAASQGGES